MKLVNPRLPIEQMSRARRGLSFLNILFSRPHSRLGGARPRISHGIRLCLRRRSDRPR